MADNFIPAGGSLADFYTGAMAPPAANAVNAAGDKVHFAPLGFNPLPTGPAMRGRPSLSEMYAQTPKPIEGLTTRLVQTTGVDMNGDPILTPQQMNARDTVVSRPATIASQPSTIDAANPLDINRLGLTSSPFSTPATEAIAAAAPTSVARMYNWSGWSPGGSTPTTSMANLEYDDPRVRAWLDEGSTMPNPAVNNPASQIGGLRERTAVAPPATPIQSLASMFTPTPSTYSQMDPSVHAQLMAQQSPGSRGQDALRASGMIDRFGMIT